MTKPWQHTILNRRDFLRLAAVLGGTTTLAALLEACSKAGIDTEKPLSPTQTRGAATTTDAYEMTATTAPEQARPTERESDLSPTPEEAGDMSNARVAFVKTRDRAEGVRKAIDLLENNPVGGKRVFLKPNFNSSDPTPGSTHPQVLITLVTMLKEMGAEKITVGDRSGMGDTRQVMEQLGVFELAEALGFETLVFDELSPEDWKMMQPAEGHWEKGYPFARPCLEAEALVQTCCLKTHRYGGHFTLSLKNSVGMVGKTNLVDGHDFMRELHSSPHQRRMIAEINAAYAPALIVLDGVEAFISGGPAQGEHAAPEVILAGTDRVAIDAVGVALLRYAGCKTEVSKGKIFQQEQIARAVELGLGVDSPEKIEFLTGDSDSAAYCEEIKEVLLA